MFTTSHEIGSLAGILITVIADFVFRLEPEVKRAVAPQSSIGLQNPTISDTPDEISINLAGGSDVSSSGWNHHEAVKRQRKELRKFSGPGDKATLAAERVLARVGPTHLLQLRITRSARRWRTPPRLTQGQRRLLKPGITPAKEVDLPQA